MREHRTSNAERRTPQGMRVGFALTGLFRIRKDFTRAFSPGFNIAGFQPLRVLFGAFSGERWRQKGAKVVHFCCYDRARPGTTGVGYEGLAMG
jgi:hypothetical protein